MIDVLFKLNYMKVFNLIKKIKWEWIAIAILGGIIIFLTRDFNKKEEVKVDVPVKLDIPIPAKEGKSDTIYLPSPIKYKENPLNKELEKLYKEAKDSLEKQRVFNEAIKEREYNEIYEDSVVKTTVYTRTQGKLLKQSVNYLVKPYNVKVDTIVNTVIQIPKRNELYYGFDTNVNMKNLTNSSIGSSLLFKNKKDKIIQFGVGIQDVNKGVSVDNLYLKGGLYFKF